VKLTPNFSAKCNDFEPLDAIALHLVGIKIIETPNLWNPLLLHKIWTKPDITRTYALTKNTKYVAPKNRRCRRGKAHC
jgi:hypothetical protein